MTNKNNFDTRITEAPIYSPIQIEKRDPLTHVPSQQITSDWQKYTDQIHQQVASTNYYGYPSLCLNSNFYWNRAIATPVTQADGDNAFFSEKWQIFGASNATYTLTRTTFPANNEDNSGSIYYINVDVSAWNGNDLYFFQKQDGAQFLRLYQNRNIYLSTKIDNSQTDLDSMNFEIFVYYDTGSETYQSAIFHLEEGINYVAGQIQLPFLDTASIGGSPYIEFRLRFNNLNDGTADFNLIYIKAEMSDSPTPFYMDAALEKTRIDNS